MNLALWITGIATAVIAWLAYSNYKLAKEIKETREKRDEETKDLFQAMVIAEVIGGSGGYDQNFIDMFKMHYKKRADIFS